jgi:hypothetical protein
MKSHLWTDWIFGDVMMPETFFPPPLSYPPLEGACVSCGSLSCRCGSVPSSARSLPLT